MKKFLTRILPYDKALHLLGGVLMYLLFLNFMSNLEAIFSIVLVAIMIEANDYFCDGTPELLDIVYTLLGALIAFVLTIFN